MQNTAHDEPGEATYGRQPPVQRGGKKITGFVSFRAFRTAVRTGLICLAFLVVSETVAGAAPSLIRVVDNTTSVPGGLGGFTDFRAPSLDGDGRVAFVGTSTDANLGIFYGVYLVANGVVQRVADEATLVPDESGNDAGEGNFERFQQAMTDGGAIALLGFSSTGQFGNYSDLGGPIRLIAREGTAIPDSNGANTSSVFAGAGAESMDAGAILIRGSGSGGERGLYRWTPESFKSLVDNTTTVPGTTKKFAGFNGGRLDSGYVAFNGTYTGGPGVFVIEPGGTLRTVIATDVTPLPQGGGNFTGVWVPAVAGGLVSVFAWDHVGQPGIYSNVGGLHLVADLSTPIPGGSGNFTSFKADVALSGNVTVFHGLGSGGQSGLYAEIDGSLVKIVAVGDSLDGKTVAVNFNGCLSAEGAQPGRIAFCVVFSDNSRAVYIAELGPASSAPVADAGEEVIGAVGQELPLSGVLSSDDETPSALLVYAWTLVSRPGGSSAELNGTTTPLASITPDLPGEYVVQLIVTDEHGLESLPDYVTISAELDPAFVFENLFDGTYDGSYQYDATTNEWQYDWQYDLMDGASFLDDGIAGNRRIDTYSYGSTSGYIYNYTNRLALLENGVETVLLAKGDPVPNGGIFESFWSHYADSDALVFQAIHTYIDGAGEVFCCKSGGFRVSGDGMVSAIYSLPIPVQNSDTVVRYVHPYLMTSPPADSADEILFGQSDEIVSVYVSTWGYTYRTYRQGYFRLSGEVAEFLVDNKTAVPGEDANFRGFGYGVVLDSGALAFLGYWHDSSTAAWRRGIFERGPDGEVRKLLDDRHPDWDRGWYSWLVSEGDEVYVGGGRYRYGYDQGQWWSSHETGIYRVGPSLVEPILVGGGSYKSSPTYQRVAFYPYPYYFGVEGGVVVTNGYWYRADSSGTVTGSGVIWKENGKVRFFEPALDAALSQYQHIGFQHYNRRAFVGRSILLTGRSYTYDSQSLPGGGYQYSYVVESDIVAARFDTDRDGIGDDLDNCPLRPNPIQEDSDLDGVGDACEDTDQDGYPDYADNCPLIPNDQADVDADSYGDACDVCPFVADSQEDSDGDGIGDACDQDRDGDLVDNTLDNCPDVPNPDQANLDGDLLGDACDHDMDGDGIANLVDGFWDGLTFTDQSLLESDYFSDHALGGKTHGQIANRGNLIILVEDAPDDDQGVIVNAVNGSGNGLVKQCDFKGRDANLRVEQGTILTLTCGSIDVRMGFGFAQLELDDDILVDLPPHAGAQVIDSGESEFVLRNPPDSPLPLEARIGADIRISVPTASAAQVMEPELGQYEIQNTTGSAQSVTAEMNGVTYVFEPGDVGMPIAIDIKPESSDNTINLTSNGIVPVAILSSAVFDATQVDPLSVSLASAAVRLKGNGSAMTSKEDVNGDGLEDIIVQVETAALDITTEATGAVLKGMTVSGVAIIGTDIVRIVKE